MSFSTLGTHVSKSKKSWPLVLMCLDFLSLHCCRWWPLGSQEIREPRNHQDNFSQGLCFFNNVVTISERELLWTVRDFGQYKASVSCYLLLSGFEESARKSLAAGGIQSPGCTQWVLHTHTRTVTLPFFTPPHTVLSEIDNSKSHLKWHP